jgi:valyl-tRNA synthetase
LAECEKTVSQAYESYEMQDALGALYRFFWSELCDWYIEVSKSRLQNPQTRATPQRVLVKCLHDFLRMLHPALPFVSEEVYEMLPIPGKQPFLMAETWPSDLTAWWDPAIDSKIENWLEATRGLRALRAEFGLAAMKSIPKVYFEGALHGGEKVVASQAWVQELVPGKPEGQKFVSTTVAGIDFHLPLEGVVDTEKELARLDREITKANEELGKLNQRLQSPAFVERAKPEVVERERSAAQALEDKITKLRERLALFSS